MLASVLLLAMELHRRNAHRSNLHTGGHSIWHVCPPRLLVALAACMREAHCDHAFVASVLDRQLKVVNTPSLGDREVCLQCHRQDLYRWA